MLALPLAIVKELRLRPVEKWGLAFIVVVGSLVMVADAFAFFIMYKFGITREMSPTDVSKITSPKRHLLVWLDALQRTAGMLAFCLPPLRHILRKSVNQSPHLTALKNRLSIGSRATLSPATFIETRSSIGGLGLGFGGGGLFLGGEGGGGGGGWMDTADSLRLVVSSVHISRFSVAEETGSQVTLLSSDALR